ncbi:sulfotransferase [Sphingomonas hylomeconis]|uniref:Sulfotransferase n=1 Tax=Sphingomonas hylomeconis TaxID=1395958 RepID=A0ABV7SX80_9SPHN|nr:sulfotransferase [Sphingomonas hylomeconis]
METGTDQSAGIGDGTLADFRALVLADPSLQARLGAIDRPDDYLAAMLASAAAQGLPLDPAAAQQAMGGGAPGIGRRMAAPVSLDRWPLPGWRPARSIATGAAPAFDWAWFGTQAPVQPFYDEAARQAATRPFSAMFRARTTFDTLVSGAPAPPAATPAGFVFHMSRCGSTLVAQMLAAVAHHIVLAEPEPLDAVVQWGVASAMPLPARVSALRAMIAALAGDLTGKRLFVKLDSWHVLALPLFRAAFPDVPWIFLYRDPIEVMVSHSRMPGIQTVAGLLPDHLFGSAGAAMPREEYCAHVLHRILQAVLDHWPSGGGLLVDYAELPAAMAQRIPGHFGFTPDASESAAMRSVPGRHAKFPGAPFVADAAGKRAAASAAIRAAVAPCLDPVHARLSALRNATDRQ